MCQNYTHIKISLKIISKFRLHVITENGKEITDISLLPLRNYPILFGTPSPSSNHWYRGTPLGTHKHHTDTYGLDTDCYNLQRNLSASG